MNIVRWQVISYVIDSNGKPTPVQSAPTIPYQMRAPFSEEPATMGDISSWPDLSSLASELPLVPPAASDSGSIWFDTADSAKASATNYPHVSRA